MSKQNLSPQLVDIKSLTPNAQNPRTIKDFKFQQLVKSIKDFPEMMEARPIVVNGKDRTILGGNMRYRACIEAGLKKVWVIDELKQWGLDIPGIDDRIDTMQDGEEIEIPQSVQLEPPKEYILIMAEPNSVEWEELKEMLKLKMVRRGGYKKGSAFDQVGLERVIEWSEFKDRLNIKPQ